MPTVAVDRHKGGTVHEESSKESEGGDPPGDVLTQLLIDADQQGGGRAFAEFLVLMRPKIMTRVEKRLPAHDADDVTEEVLVKVWMSRARFDPKLAGASTWVWRITDRVLIDFYRRYGRRLEHEVHPQPLDDETDDEWRDRVGPLERSAEDECEGKMRPETWCRNVDDRPPAQQRAMKNKAAGEPADAVAAHRARNNLRAHEDDWG